MKAAHHSLWNDPSESPDLGLDPSLLDARVVRLELVREAETDYGQPLVVELGVALVKVGLVARSTLDQTFELTSSVRDGRYGSFAGRLDLRPVDVGQQGVVSGVFQCSGDHSRLCQIVLHDPSVSVETEIQDCETLSASCEVFENCSRTVEHLTQDWVSGSTEVHVERVVGLSKVVKLEDELLGKELLASPDDPSYTDSAHSVFVS